jgi:hypothetical protein
MDGYKVIMTGEGVAKRTREIEASIDETRRLFAADADSVQKTITNNAIKDTVEAYDAANAPFIQALI